MRGFFAALRMTDKDKKQIPPLRSTPASKDRSPGIPGCGMTNFGCGMTSFDCGMTNKNRQE